MLRSCGWRRDGEKSAFVNFSVSDQARDIMVLKQGIGEDLGRGEPGVCSVECYSRWIDSGPTATLRLTRRIARFALDVHLKVS